VKGDGENEKRRVSCPHAWNHAVMRQVDDKTLSVLDLPVPPGMAYDGDGVIKDPN